MILRTDNLTKRFGDLVAVSSVDLEVEKGEILGIAGPNGAGKSTLFNLISGIFAPSSGTVEFEGRDITNLKPHIICKLGISRTFQIPCTFSTMTVMGNIRVGALFGYSRRRSSEVERKVEEIMSLLELWDKKDVLAENLDLYTTKLVMFGAALSTNSKLILLDEPMAGLSMTEIDHFGKLMRKLNAEQSTTITILIIEHLIDTLVMISNRIVVLHLGHVIYSGLAAKMLQDRKVIEVYLGEREK